MKLLTIIWVSCLFFSSHVFAEYGDTEISNVKKIKELHNGNYKVKCNDKTKGKVSFEENNICVFSKKNRKNHCKPNTVWTIESAASYICDGNIIKDAPLFHEEAIDND